MEFLSKSYLIIYMQSGQQVHNSILCLKETLSNVARVCTNRIQWTFSHPSGGGRFFVDHSLI